MQFSTPKPRPKAESIVPMINVVFLLLIFFLMTAQIAPPEPFEVTPPTAAAEDPADTGDILYVSAEGEFGFRDLKGDDAIAALSERENANSPLLIRADASVDASVVAGLMPRLAGVGITDATLLTAATGE
ncbi:biopolymer transporter ExbD [Qingshengfaniella alkalisoli]|uniref:Biopolymer transporter ExbD n=2 Tax=Qingshengfaniella alkalisoli TaxID=2599296 RepID=A0A5B8J780_9RHOB|nr:biopolymer transporter ExbD [Qingshengfaniella alkalisoli]